MTATQAPPEDPIAETLLDTADAVFALHVTESLRLMHARGLLALADAEQVVAAYETLTDRNASRRGSLRRIRFIFDRPPSPLIDHAEAESRLRKMATRAETSDDAAWMLEAAHMLGVLGARVMTLNEACIAMKEAARAGR